MAFLPPALLATPASAQTPNVLYDAAVESSLRPERFDAWFAANRGRFDAGTVNCLRQKTLFWSQKAREHQQQCNIYSDPISHQNCLQNNQWSGLLLWGGSLLLVIEQNAAWLQTPQGQIQIQAWQACKLLELTMPGACEIIRTQTQQFVHLLKPFLVCP
jgi:hypothetical protein